MCVCVFLKRWPWWNRMSLSQQTMVKLVQLLPSQAGLFCSGRAVSHLQRWEYCSCVLGWDVSVKITPPHPPSPSHTPCCSQTLPEFKQRALDVLLETGHFMWRLGPTFCRTQITRAICHGKDLHHFLSDRGHFQCSSVKKLNDPAQLESKL